MNSRLPLRSLSLITNTWRWERSQNAATPTGWLFSTCMNARPALQRRLDKSLQMRHKAEFLWELTIYFLPPYPSFFCWHPAEGKVSVVERVVCLQFFLLFPLLCHSLTRQIMLLCPIDLELGHMTCSGQGKMGGSDHECVLS